jgi:hypothetical protein
VNTPTLVSYEDPQRLKVVVRPSPTNVYQTPGAVFRDVPQVPTASRVAPAVVPVTVCAQLIVSAPVQRSLTGGAVQVLVNVKAPALVPKPVTRILYCVPTTVGKLTWDCSPQKSSLPVTQTNAAQVPLKTPIFVS